MTKNIRVVLNREKQGSVLSTLLFNAVKHSLITEVKKTIVFADSLWGTGVWKCWGGGRTKSHGYFNLIKTVAKITRNLHIL